MNSKNRSQFLLFTLALLVCGVAFGQAAATPRTSTPIASAAPTITILAAPAGAILQSQGTNNASMNLGPVSYFKGTSAVGETSQKNPDSFVVSTRFELKVDCPGNSSSQVSLTASRLDASSSHAIAIDGVALGSVAQIVAPSMRCGSAGDHRLDVEVPTSTPAGPIESTLAFVATLKP